jgi:hypothetical protein
MKGDQVAAAAKWGRWESRGERREERGERREG